MRRVSGAFLLLLILAPVPLRAQQPEPARLFQVDVELFHASLSLLWPVAGAWWVGPDVGGGILEQKTFAPSGDDFTPMVHAGVALSRRMTPRISLDVGVRVGFGELRSTACSGCIPPAYGAAVLGGSWGGDTFRAGSRVTLARVSEATVVAWSPLFLRLRF